MKKSIFVLEDNEDLRELFTIILEEESYEVRTFPNVSSFQHYVGVAPDLYLLDIMLPDGDGLEICRKIKNDNSTTHIPVVMMSAHVDADDVMKNVSANGFIAKPFDVTHLTAYIADKVGT